ncbi:hypothetical protein GCM10028805_55660 [Spirosoma harenae]
MKFKSILLYVATIALFTSCEENEAKPDTTCGGKVTFTLINKTPERLEISVQGSIPSGCGSVSPDSKCTTTVPTGISISYAAKGISSGKSWNGQRSFANCTGVDLSLTY